MKSLPKTITWIELGNASIDLLNFEPKYIFVNVSGKYSTVWLNSSPNTKWVILVEGLDFDVPKFGFKNINRKEYRTVNLSNLQKLIDDKKIEIVDKNVLIENGFASKNDLIKILGNGELKGKVEVTADKFSASAKKAIEDNGGTATIKA